MVVVVLRSVKSWPPGMPGLLGCQDRCIHVHHLSDIRAGSCISLVTETMKKECRTHDGILQPQPSVLAPS